MKRLTLAAATLALAAATAHADVTIVDNDRKLTVDCAKDRTVNIVGNKATVTLKGTCDAVSVTGNDATVKGSAIIVSVSGNDNILELDAVDGIIVSGNDNKVSYRKPVKEKATRVANSGNDNKVSRAK